MFYSSVYNAKGKNTQFDRDEGKSQNLKNFSRTTTNWKKQGFKQNELRVSLETIPDTAILNVAASQQAGSIDPFQKKFSNFDPTSDKSKTELNDILGQSNTVRKSLFNF